MGDPRLQARGACLARNPARHGVQALLDAHEIDLLERVLRNR
jgi:hypothetical protein